MRSNSMLKLALVRRDSAEDLLARRPPAVAIKMEWLRDPNTPNGYGPMTKLAIFSASSMGVGHINCGCHGQSCRQFLQNPA